jgi:hypothetical protein
LQQPEEKEMPATSRAQFRFMEGVKHGSIKKKGLTPEKAAEYVNGGHNEYTSLPEKKSKFNKLKKLCMGGKY